MWLIALRNYNGITTGFFCDGELGEGKFHLANWKTVCQPLQTGNLVIEVLFSSTITYWGSGYGRLLWKQILYGE